MNDTPTSPLVPAYSLPIQVQKKNDAMNQAVCTASPSARAPVPLLLGPENTMCECPFCNASIKTAVRYSTTSRTHIAAVLFCITCCLCCVPYMSDSARNADHYCPSCNKYLGTYEK